MYDTKSATLEARLLQLSQPGRVSYSEALLLQERARDALFSGAGAPTLFLLQHPPTITLGSAAAEADSPLAPEALRGLGYDVHQTNRGGKATYHGTGQLVAYPVLDLAEIAKSNRTPEGCTGAGPSVRTYLRDLEECVLKTLARLGVEGMRRPGAAGVWVGERKIASVGVAVRRWVTTHGFALNVNPDLALFDVIRPCGFDPSVMTSVAREGGNVPAWDELLHITAQEFAAVFGFFIGDALC